MTLTVLSHELAEGFGPVEIRHVLAALAEDVAALPQAAVPLVGAFIATQPGLAPWLYSWVMAQLGTRTYLGAVSPAAEAVMRICEFSKYKELEFAQDEINAQFALLKALELESALRAAVAFMVRFADRLAMARDLLKNYQPEMVS
jgi:hypothetical protein